MRAENSIREGRRDPHSSSVDWTALVSYASESISSTSTHSTSRCAGVTIQQKEASTEEETTSDGLCCIRDRFQVRGFSKEVSEILFASWRESTAKQYQCYFRKWLSFCEKRNSDPFCYSEPETLEFLFSLYKSGVGYSGLNTARSALSMFLINAQEVPIGKSTHVKRFMKGIFHLRPSLPRYVCIWDVDIVLNYLKSLFPLTELSVKYVTYKLVMLLALISAQRAQTLHLIDLRNIIEEQDFIVILIGDLLKQSSPGTIPPILKIPKYPEKALCFVHTLLYYKEITSNLRSCNKLFISLCKPHKAVSTSTISRWLKNTLHEAGIEVAIFKAHSTRSASCSAAKRANISSKDIMKAAGWKNANTFEKFYDKVVIPHYGQNSQAVL